MNIKKISIGKDAPNYVNVIIEVPMNADPVKYEMDKDSGAIFVDRFIATPMFYPCNYGFVPNTLSDDGDPCDVLVVCCFCFLFSPFALKTKSSKKLCVFWKIFPPREKLDNQKQPTHHKDRH